MRIIAYSFVAFTFAAQAFAQQNYLVQPGDTLQTIASRQLGDLDAWNSICVLNRLESCDRIMTGMTLELPVGNDLASVPAPAEPPAEPVTQAPAEERAPRAATQAEPGRGVNLVANSRLSGAAVGAGGTLLQTWSIGGFDAAEVVAVGEEEGLPYVDIRLNGTPSGSAVFINFLDSANPIAAAGGQTWTSSAYVRLVAGDLTQVDRVFLRLQEFVGSVGGDSGGTDITDALASRTRVSTTRTLSGGATDRLISFFRIGLTGGAVDMTLRISAPQIEQADTAGPVQLTGG